ncbi:MAG: bile acid:sodium symporter family protein [Planctomycetota bacterium]
MTGARACWALSAVLLAATAVAALLAQWAVAKPLLVAYLATTAVAFTLQASLRSFAFTVWVFAFVAASLGYPWAFGTWVGVDLRILIVPLIQIIMFGMGTTLCVADFTRVLKMPWPVLVGMLLQFSVMPLAGLALAKSFGFEPEIAAGIVLIGSCPGGVASNVMTYIARADVALSVTMTTASTLMSPVMTPLMMKFLASEYVSIRFVAMMLDICNMIIVPIAAGLIANRILYGQARLWNRAASLAAIAAVSFAVAALSLLGDPAPLLERLGLLEELAVLKGGVVVGFAMIGIVAAAKLVISVMLHGPRNWMDSALPVVSMAGICYIIAIITARSSEDLLRVGPMLIAVAVVHNLVGYLLGYWGAKLARLDERACRTVAFEVGMQNGGMASGLAMNTLKSASAALAPAIFGPWMNVSGSILATWWHRKPVVTVGSAPGHTVVGEGSSP